MSEPVEFFYTDPEDDVMYPNTEAINDLLQDIREKVNSPIVPNRTNDILAPLAQLSRAYLDLLEKYVQMKNMALAQQQMMETGDLTKVDSLLTKRAKAKGQNRPPWESDDPKATMNKPSTPKSRSKGTVMDKLNLIGDDPMDDLLSGDDYLNKL